MKFVGTLLVTLAAALLAQWLNPLIRVSPVETYGMELRHQAGDLTAIIAAVVLVKLLLLTVVGYGSFIHLRGWPPVFVRLCVSSLAISAVSILFFLATSIPCSPNFLILFCAFDATFSAAVGVFAKGRRSRESTPVRNQLSRRRFVLTAILAGGVPLSLAVLAWSYKRWPEVQRQTNLVQNQFGSKGEYVLENVFGELRFRQLVDFAIVPGTGEIFVLERRGRLYRIDPGREEAILAVDFSKEVGDEPVDELGAYSLVLHPDFRSGFDERLFVFHTRRKKESKANFLVEYDLRPGASEAGPPGRRVVLKIPATGTSHNSGSLDFDPEGFLFVGLGDAELKEPSQDPGSLLGGKILRIDPDKSGGDRSYQPPRPAAEGVIRDYFIPSGNPFTDVPEIHGEVWAIGVRNPFRARWEPRLQALLTGDVGQLRWEEINLFRAGDNGGWPVREATSTYDSESPMETVHSNPRLPFFSYPHDALNRAIVCGPCYEGKRHPDLTGMVIFGDNFSGLIWAIQPDGSDPPKLLARAPDFNQSGISKIAHGPNGEIWIAVMGAQSVNTGTIYRLNQSGSSEIMPTQADRQPAEIFVSQCAFCHGPEGRGKSPAANEFPVKLPDFSSFEWQEGIGENALSEVIRNGGPAIGKTAFMPAWHDILTETEITGLVNHIRGLAKD